MTSERRTANGEALTELIVEVFRLNGRLLVEGDRLVAHLGMTSARWQVLGAIAYSPTPEPVARLARNMGLNRQGVQRIVNELADDGLVEFRPNPHHQRAKLVMLTPMGSQAYDKATALQVPWVNALANGLGPAEIATAARLIKTLRRRLEAAGDNEIAVD